MDSLRVATLNVWHRSDPWPRRLEVIRAELARLAPDVLGLQEVLRPTQSSAGDQASEIADALGYHIAYAPACVWEDSTYFGNAILSRHPILETSSALLPGHDRGESRSAVYALIATPHGKIPVFVTHLNWRPEDFATRLEQVVFLVDWIEARAPTRSAGAILTGDFNAEPGSAEIRYVAERFVDAWDAGGGGGPGHTWDTENPYTHVHEVHSQRIDYIFVRAPLQVASARVCFDQPEDGVWPSDHFGLVAHVRPG